MAVELAVESFGIQFKGMVGRSFEIDVLDDLGGLGDWSKVGELTVTQPSQIWEDPQLHTRSYRFYRIRQKP